MPGWRPAAARQGLILPEVASLALQPHVPKCCPSLPCSEGVESTGCNTGISHQRVDQWIMWSSAGTWGGAGEDVNIGTAPTGSRVLVTHPACPHRQDASSCVRHLCVVR